MDPYNNQRKQQPNPRTNPNLRDSHPDNSGRDETPDIPGRPAADSGNPPAADRQPRYSGGFTVIPPNESRRSKMQMMAQKEEEDLQRHRDMHRVTSVHVNPERLGGNGTEAEARDRQAASLRGSKLQKQLKREEETRRRKQEEEEENARKKAECRAKAERLKERERREEQMRQKLHQQDHLRATERLLQGLEIRAPGPLASGSAAHTSRTSEASETPRAPRSEREVRQEQQRVNSAWLDRLEARAGGSQSVGVREQEEEEEEAASGELDPAESWTDDAEPDFDWALMKLVNSFPDYSKDNLKEILDECAGDYDRAYTLLQS